jgi:hypothetical protein
MIIVEDGTCVPGANSLISLEELNTFLTQRGLDIPLNLEAMLFNANEMFTFMFKTLSGTPVCPESLLLFPRSGMVDITKNTTITVTFPPFCKQSLLFLCAYLTFMPKDVAIQRLNSVDVASFFKVSYNDTLDSTKLDWAEHFLQYSKTMMQNYLITANDLEPTGNFHRLTR